MKLKYLFLILLFLPIMLFSQNKVYPGADENSISRSEYFSWLNNTNEGATESQTLANLNFFKWLHDTYGMTLDIYALDAGQIDGKNFYGSMNSDRFKSKFPNSFGKVTDFASTMNTRFGIWGGPDGFGKTEEDANNRIKEFVSLCKDYNWELFKFDAVCGPLRPDKEKYFVKMMQECRKYSPDLILLNHRLGLKEGKKYATTFLWQGMETYIDVHCANNKTAIHNRVTAMSRGEVPHLQRLTEDHGVCLSSCLNFWDDELVIQAFNRSLILAPEIYGNPWLLKDSEFPKLARLFNLHKKFDTLLVHGMVLPETYGKYAVSRGDSHTRIITLENMSWYSKTCTLNLNSEIGLVNNNKKVEVRCFHPTEKLIGKYNYGDKVDVNIPSFRSVLLMVTSVDKNITGIDGADYNVVKDNGKDDIVIDVLGMPGTSKMISLVNPKNYRDAFLQGKRKKSLIKGHSIKVDFKGDKLLKPIQRKLGEMSVTVLPKDKTALYEATVFAADNNALETRCLKRSGETSIPEVKVARDAFFHQSTFVNRGVWDRNLFDSDMNTEFRPSSRWGSDLKIKHGCMRIDLGAVYDVDSLILKVRNESCLDPLFIDEGSYAFVSTDLQHWKGIVYLTGLKNIININGKVRYIKLVKYPSRVAEVEVYSNNKKLSSDNFRVNNLFAGRKMNAQKAWKLTTILSEIPKNSYICVAINGKHGVEGAYATLKVEDKYIGAPRRAPSYPANPWEFNVMSRDSNYTYFIPIDSSYEGKQLEFYVLGYDTDNLNFKPEVWIANYEMPYVHQKLILKRDKNN